MAAYTVLPVCMQADAELLRVSLEPGSTPGLLALQLRTSEHLVSMPRHLLVVPDADVCMELSTALKQVSKRSGGVLVNPCMPLSNPCMAACNKGRM